MQTQKYICIIAHKNPLLLRIQLDRSRRPAYLRRYSPSAHRLLTLGSFIGLKKQLHATSFHGEYFNLVTRSDNQPAIQTQLRTPNLDISEPFHLPNTPPLDPPLVRCHLDRVASIWLCAGEAGRHQDECSGDALVAVETGEAILGIDGLGLVHQFKVCSVEFDRGAVGR